MPRLPEIDEAKLSPDQRIIYDEINHVRGVCGNTIDQISSVTLNSGSGANLLLSGTEIAVWGSD